MIKIRSAVILIKNESILLAKHSKKNRDYWVIPGGTAEEGETIEETAVREIMEETGLKVKIKKLAFVSEVIDKLPPRHILDFFFEGCIISGRLEKGCDSCLCEVKFMPFEELDNLEFYPRIKPELKQMLQNRKAGPGAYLGNRNL